MSETWTMEDEVSLVAMQNRRKRVMNGNLRFLVEVIEQNQLHRIINAEKMAGAMSHCSKDIIEALTPFTQDEQP